MSWDCPVAADLNPAMNEPNEPGAGLWAVRSCGGDRPLAPTSNVDLPPQASSKSSLQPDGFR